MNAQTPIEPYRVPLLAPPIPERWQVVANARRRGISESDIAAVLAVSRQRVAQILEKYERRRGAVMSHAPGYQRFRRGTKSSFKCTNCGSAEWIGQKFLSRDRSFCSMRCRSLFDRELSAAEIKLCIQSRINGVTWKSLSQTVGRPFQTIQASIWRYLHESGALATGTLEQIWRPTGSGHASWQWLVNQTGLEPR